jgi:endonuclease YncB( thermonuclease family)
MPAVPLRSTRRACAVERIGERTVYCREVGRDRYGRMLAFCFASGEELNEFIVRSGWALAFRRYSHRYAQTEDGARRQKAGAWAGKFLESWEWRRLMPGDCGW